MRLKQNASVRLSQYSRSSDGAIGGGYYVRATLTDGTVDRIEGLVMEGEAGRWIKNESIAWLHQRSNAPKNKKLPS
jgi:hypothetical protein